MAANGASVIAGDWHEVRARRTQLNSTMLGIGTDRLSVVAADGTRPPLRPASMDRVLVDAPCSGLGVLRRRPDARWRIRADDLPRLQQLQRRLLDAAAGLVTPGGWLVYSVCTLSAVETLAVDEHLAVHHPDFEPVELPGEPWVSHGRGALLLPQVAGTDGMFLLRAHKR
jgi:16S rRNA (cytosine967-C5)-methyltransferase